MSEAFPPAQRAAAALVRLYVPEASGAQQKLRVRICAARDRARGKAGWASSPESAQLHHLAAQIADVWWRRRGIGLEELEDVLKVFSYLAMAAETLERLESDG